MTIADKLTVLRSEVDELNKQLNALQQESNKVTTEIIKKVGAIEALESMVEDKPDDALSKSAS